MSARLIHLSVWQGRRQCAAGRVSRWAVSRGRGPRDAFAALCRQGHKHPWVFFSFFLLAVLDSSLLVVVNCVYKLKQHMAAWVECVCVSANAFFFLKKSCLFKARLSGCRLVSESLCEVIRSDGRMWEFGIKWVVAALKAASYLADGAESENPF